MNCRILFQAGVKHVIITWLVLYRLSHYQVATSAVLLLHGPLRSVLLCLSVLFGLLCVLMDDQG